MNELVEGLRWPGVTVPTFLYSLQTNYRFPPLAHVVFTVTQGSNIVFGRETVATDKTEIRYVF